MSRHFVGSSIGNKLATEITDAFGLKNVVSLDIHIARNEIFTVTAKIYPEVDGFRQAVAVLKMFELVPILDGKETPQ